MDERDDAGSVEGSSEADVVHVAVDAQRDVAGVDAVMPDAELRPGALLPYRWSRSSWVVGKYRLRVLALVAGFDENLGCERFG